MIPYFYCVEKSLAIYNVIPYVFLYPKTLLNLRYKALFRIIWPHIIAVFPEIFDSNNLFIFYWNIYIDLFCFGQINYWLETISLIYFRIMR